MKVGDLIKMPTCSDSPEALGIIVQLPPPYRPRHIGVRWFDSDRANLELIKTLEIVSEAR